MTEVLQPNVDWHALAPEIVLTAAACLVLVADLFLPREAKWVAMPLAAAGLVASLAAVVSLIGQGDRMTLAGSFEVDPFALLFKGLFSVIGLIVLAMSFNYFRAGRYYQGEYYFLLLCSLLGAFVMAGARDLVSIFIAIELISIPAIIMVALRKGDPKSNESALKFFLFSVMSSAVMLYGMSLIYGVTGHTQVDRIREALGSADEPVVALSVFFIVVGFAFKISAVPFHFWAPDTYEGAPSPVAAFLSTASKIGGFVGLLVLMFRAFPGVADQWRPAFAVLAVLTMTVGNLIALRQQHIIRLLAYSGIAQSGYVLVCLALITPGAESNAQAFESALIYLAIYALMDLGAFAAAVAFARKGGTYFISDYSGLWRRSPALATLMAGFLISLAGTPPMAGFWAKLFVFKAAIDANVVWLAVVMAVNAVIAAWYYLFVVKKMFFDVPVEVEDPVEVPYLLRLAMGVAALALFAAFVYPQLITRLAEESSLLGR